MDKYIVIRAKDVVMIEFVKMEDEENVSKTT